MPHSTLQPGKENPFLRGLSPSDGRLQGFPPLTPYPSTPNGKFTPGGEVPRGVKLPVFGRLESVKAYATTATEDDTDTFRHYLFQDLVANVIATWCSGRHSFLVLYTPSKCIQYISLSVTLCLQCPSYYSREESSTAASVPKNEKRPQQVEGRAPLRWQRSFSPMASWGATCAIRHRKATST